MKGGDMEDLYDELIERLKYLEEEDYTAEISTRINELTLVMVRIQQILLKKIK